MPQTFNVGSRSLFVSVTAWVFILFGMAATALSVIQGAATAALLPGFDLSLDVKPLLGLVQVLGAHLPWVAGAALAVSIGVGEPGETVDSRDLVDRFDIAAMASLGRDPIFVKNLYM